MKNNSKINILDAVPVRSEHVRTEYKDECVVLAFPRFKHKWMERWFLPKRMSPYIRVTLEEKGTAVWQLIDGHRTVRELTLSLAETFKGEDDLDARISTYILQLHKDGFIKLVLPK